MSSTVRIIFQPYVFRTVGKRKQLSPGIPIACRDEQDALRRIDKVKAGLGDTVGAQAVRMLVDEDAGDYGDPEILGIVGEVPKNDD
ncbi:hypothetical protein HK14_03150 [Acetobacter cibinongensis]|uniref:Uncharacterized protein n=1 Tax=Acetobacter cibinongensis TaxID=146475 RepID=A0A1Z5YVZ4_9PROT|nr:hypothetical protein HK14_03150 [Acetobacter cibinongensis]